MIPLLLSILSSSLIFVIFKLFPRFKIDTLQAIVVNYFMAFTIGISLYGHTWNPKCLEETSWMPSVFLCAFLFIGLFLLIGRSSQMNGVASTSVAVKMSMAIALILMIVGYGEALNWLKVAGIALAFMGVYLVSTTRGTNQKNEHVWMLIVLFFVCGGFDFLLSYIQDSQLKSIDPALFSAIGLGLAGILGLIILAIQSIRGKTKFAVKNLLAGLILGIPNFFSIYLLMRSYQSTGWESSKVLAINNVSIVLLSALFGFLVFKENATRMKLIGLLTAILAIVTLYFAT